MFELSFSAEREGLATTLPWVAPLNAFPFCSPQGPLQAQLYKKGSVVNSGGDILENIVSLCYG